MISGESPAQCAQREIMEEAGIHVPIERLHLSGLISERAYEGKGHWLLFYYRVLGPVQVEWKQINEGALEWHHPDEIEALPLPETDRRIIWPLIRKGEKSYDERILGSRPGFFALHIDCEADGRLVWKVEQEEF